MIIKLFEDFNNIHDICTKYEIDNYSINSDASIDVQGDVRLRNKNLSKIPIKFNRVSGFFDIAMNPLASLENSPNYVGADFIANKCTLTSLMFSPSVVIGDYYIFENKLKTLRHITKGCPGYGITMNPLPSEFVNRPLGIIKKIITNQDDYGIWKKDDTLNIVRYNMLIDDIKNNII